jgi:hypothetical protein
MNKVIATDARRLLQPFPFLAASFYKSQTTVRKPETVVTQQDVNRFGSRFTGLDFSPRRSGKAYGVILPLHWF